MSRPELEDHDRLLLRPEVQLRAWEKAARPMSELVDAPIRVLARELPRSALVLPQQPTTGLGELVARLGDARPVTPEDRMAVVAAVNALACLGIDVPQGRNRLGLWMAGLVAVEPPFPGRLAAAFAALSISDVSRTAQVSPLPFDVEGGEVFPGDLHALVGYAAWLVHHKGSLPALQPGLDRVAEHVELLVASQQLDESTALWIARFAFHTFGGAPLGEVAARAHAWLWAAPARLDAERAKSPKPPIGSRIRRGASMCM